MTKTVPAQVVEFHRLPIPLDRDLFARHLLREFTRSLEVVVGAEGAEKFIGDIGAATGQQFNTYYRAALRTTSLTRGQVAEALVDLKRRIQGDFYVIELTEEKIVLGNRACPFGNKVVDRPALCMMTSSVFGSISSANLGYAKVELQQTIARHDPECRVVVYLRPTAEAEASTGREYSSSRI
jgi:predicted ArsR family transcriptional regulator